MNSHSKTASFLLVALLLFGEAAEIGAQGITYTYDDLGRLRQVIDTDGEAATYTYDAVGNILSIARGDGGCPLAPPGVNVVRAERCFAGTSCPFTVEGTSLLGAAVQSLVDDAAITDCRSECNRLTCVLSANPSVPAGPVRFEVSNPRGAVQASVEVEPPPTLDGGRAATWHFAANAGQAITLGMTRIPNQPDGTSTLDPVLDLLDSRGFLVAQDDDGGSNLPLGPGRNALIRDLTLPATDTYVIVARGAAGTSGPYVLDMLPPTITLVPGLVIQPPHDRETVFGGDIARIGERDTFTFAANAGERITIEARRVANNPDGSGTLDPRAELRDSRGFLIASDSDTGPNTPPGPGRNALIANLLLPATDTYRITVSGEGGTVGPYELRITLKGPAAPGASAGTGK